MKNLNKRKFFKYGKKVIKRFKAKPKENYNNFKFPFTKIILIIFLLIIYFTKDKARKNLENIGNLENLDETKLSKYEHYKLLLPKKNIMSLKKLILMIKLNYLN